MLSAPSPRAAATLDSTDFRLIGLGNPPHLPDADLGVEFVSNALSLPHLHFVISTEVRKASISLDMMLSGSTADSDHLAIRLVIIAKIMLLRFSINNI